MITKALVIGAPPRPFEGPWVGFPEGGRWEVEIDSELEGKVVLELDQESSHRLTGGMEFEAEKARVIVEDEVDLPVVSIIARRLS